MYDVLLTKRSNIWYNADLLSAFFSSSNHTKEIVQNLSGKKEQLHGLDSCNFIECMSSLKF